MPPARALLPLLALLAVPAARAQSAPAAAPGSSPTVVSGGDAIKPFVRPAVGKAAPDFSLLDESGNRISNETLKGAPYLLAFYPKDFTGG